jgi:hypothetical protein
MRQGTTMHRLAGPSSQAAAPSCAAVDQASMGVVLAEVATTAVASTAMDCSHMQSGCPLVDTAILVQHPHWVGEAGSYVEASCGHIRMIPPQPDSPLRRILHPSLSSLQ